MRVLSVTIDNKVAAGATLGIASQQYENILLAVVNRIPIADLHFQRQIHPIIVPVSGLPFRDHARLHAQEEFRGVNEFQYARFHDIAFPPDKKRLVAFLDAIESGFDFRGCTPLGLAFLDRDGTALDEFPVGIGGRAILDLQGNADVLCCRNIRNIGDYDLQGLFTPPFAESLLNRRPNLEGMLPSEDPQCLSHGALIIDTIPFQIKSLVFLGLLRGGPACLRVSRIGQRPSEVEIAGCDTDCPIEVVVPLWHRVGALNFSAIVAGGRTWDENRPAVQEDPEFGVGRQRHPVIEFHLETESVSQPEIRFPISAMRTIKRRVQRFLDCQVRHCRENGKEVIQGGVVSPFPGDSIGCTPKICSKLNILRLIQSRGADREGQGFATRLAHRTRFPDIGSGPRGSQFGRSENKRVWEF